MYRSIKLVASFAIFSLFTTSLAAEEIFKTSNSLPSYKAGSVGSGEISSIGSDSMDGLMALWTERYSALQPKAKIKNFGRGSAAAPAALIDGSADMGPMARPMKSAEQSAFLEKFGFKPTSVTTSFAAVAVYVSKDNPLEEITLEQLDAIFSGSAIRSGETAHKWRDLGLRGEFGSADIVKVGRATHLPLTLYFRQRALLQEDFTESLMQTSTLDSLFQSIAANSRAIGFGEAVRASDKVKILAIKEDANSPAVLPSYNNIVNGSYPLSRALSVNFVRTPGEKIDRSLEDFIQFVLSSEGQQIVEAQGFIPLSEALREAELAKLR